jgi:hypothetical protein
MRQKYSIFDREPDTKKGCYEFIQKKKKQWGVDYFLNDKEIKYMKDLMSNYYYTPLEQAKPFVQGKWKETKDKIKFISIQNGPIFFEPRFEFYNVHPRDINNFFTRFDEETGKGEQGPKQKILMWDFSVARCICFGGNGMVHESLPPKRAVIEALRNSIAADKLQWKRNQGYSAINNQRKDAHHVDGKEFKTIYLKFLNTIKISEEDFISMLYPTHGDFDTSRISYIGMMNSGIGWDFKKEDDKIRKAWIKFHNRNVSYELIDPISHRSITSEETKFNTNIRNIINEME